VPRTRPPYPEEFRREAIRLAQLGDKPQRKLAKDLGISDVTLRNWLKRRRPSGASALPTRLARLGSRRSFATITVWSSGSPSVSLATYRERRMWRRRSSWRPTDGFLATTARPRDG
jgi:transposase-like protein